MSEIMAVIRLLEASGDKMHVAFEIGGRTHRVPGTLTPDEARAAVETAKSLGATRINVWRFEV